MILIRKKDIPNLLTISRIILSPFSLIFVFYSYSPLYFLIYIAAVHITDILDGHLARKYSAVSHKGRKLDSYADYVLTTSLIIGISVLAGDELLSNTFNITLILCSFIIPFIAALIKLGYIPQLHLYTNKICWGIAFVFLATTILYKLIPSLYLLSTFLFIIAGIDRLLFYIYLKDEHDMKTMSSWGLIKRNI